jgi:Protein of unknown function (DUF3175)
MASRRASPRATRSPRATVRRPAGKAPRKKTGASAAVKAGSTAGKSSRAPSRPAGRKAKEAPAGRRWSKHVMETSDAMDLGPGVFKQRSPKAIAASLKRSAERSRRRKAGPFQSAMSMLNFYLNRGGKNLTAAEKSRLEKAKGELRALFGRE